MNAGMQAFIDGEKRRMDRVLALDFLRLRRRAPKRFLQWAYDMTLRTTRRTTTPEAAAIGVGDFTLRSDDLADCLDVVAVCRV